MYRIIIAILACVSLLGCASLPAPQSAPLDQELKSDVLTCQKNLSTMWRASTRFVSNNDTIVILCEYSQDYANDKVWDCIFDKPNNHYDCRYKKSAIQVSKEHIPMNPSDRYDLFCGPCLGGWK
jgi:hypothetical protein